MNLNLKTVLAMYLFYFTVKGKFRIEAIFATSRGEAEIIFNKRYAHVEELEMA